MIQVRGITAYFFQHGTDKTIKKAQKDLILGAAQLLEGHVERIINGTIDVYKKSLEVRRTAFAAKRRPAAARPTRIDPKITVIEAEIVEKKE